MIYVCDSHMGCGKTSAAIQMINNLAKESIRPKILFITPYLDEIERIKNTVNIELIEPEICFKNGSSNKMNSFKDLIYSNCDIISTHALFKNIDMEILDLLHKRNYILILDEVFQVIESIPIKVNDLKLLIDNKWIIPVEGDNLGRYQWNYEVAPKEDTTFEYIKRYSDTKNLYIFNDNALYWTFPVEAFKIFKDVYILTYLFDAQIQSYYYKLHNMDYIKLSAKEKDGIYYFDEFDPQQDTNFRNNMKKLLNIYDGNLNYNYMPLRNKNKQRYSLSVGWYKNKDNTKEIKRIKSNLENYFRNIVNAKANNRLWTCWKDDMDIVKGRYGKQFLSYTTRATNNYKHVENIAFLINIFMNPNEENYFTYQNIKVNVDLKAISDLLQFIFRGCIRDNKPMNLYLPSARMRNLLNDFMDGKI